MSPFFFPKIMQEILIQSESSPASWWLGLVVVVQGSLALLYPVPVSQAKYERL